MDENDTNLIVNFLFLPQETFSRKARRVVIIGLAFLFGLLGEHIWEHYIHTPNTAPSYYYPLVTGVALQLYGPYLAQHRVWLVGVSVGTAVGISLVSATAHGELSTDYLLATGLSGAGSVLNLQLLIADLRKNGSGECRWCSSNPWS